MFSDALINGLLTVLAVAGAAALVLRLARSIGRMLLASAALAAARSGGEASARRGDLTGMQEGKTSEKRARGAAATAGAASVVWILWLVVPIPLDLLPAAYAAAAALWILPGRRPVAGLAGRE